MRIATFILLSTFLLNSCTSYRATLENRRSQRFGLLSGEPKWKKKRSSASIFYVPPIIGLGAGYYLGAGKELTIGDKTYSESETQTAYALGGFAVGLGLNLLIKAIRPEGRTYNKSQQKDWLVEYNKAYRSKYLYSDLNRNTDKLVFIIPGKKYNRYEADYNQLLTSARSGRLDFTQVHRAQNKLDQEFSVFSNEKRNTLRNALDQGKQDYASNYLINRLERIKLMNDDLNKMEAYLELNTSSHKYFTALRPDTRASFNDKISKSIIQSLQSLIRFRNSSIAAMLTQSSSSIKQINDLLREFESRLSKFSSYDDLGTYYANLVLAKTKFVTAQGLKVLHDIENTSSVEQLQVLRLKYIYGASLQNPEIKNFDNLITLNETRINKELKLQALRQKEQSLLKKKIMLDEQSATGEPSESQMRYALEQQLLYAKQRANRLSSMSGDDPISLTAKIFFSIPTSVNVQLNSLNKIGCKESLTKPGFICDYTTEGNIDGSGMDQPLNDLMDVFGGTLQTGRFLKANGEWVLMEQIK